MMIILKQVGLIALCLVSFCLMLNACASGVTTTENTLITTTANTPVSTTPDTYDTDGGTIDEPIYYISDLDEYRQHLKAEKLPNDFVDYDSLSKLGEFASFGYYDTYDVGYWYEIRNNEQLLWLDIYPISRRPLPTPTATLSPAIKDLTSIKEACVIQVGSAVYCYTTQGLRSINWTDSEHIYSLGGSQLSADRSFMGRLLDCNTAEAAIEELQKDIANRRK